METNQTKPTDWTPSKDEKVQATQDISYPSHPNALQTTMTLIQKGTLGEVVLPNSSSGKHLVRFMYYSDFLGGYATIDKIEVLPSWIEPASQPVEPTWIPAKHEKVVTTKELILQPADADHFRPVYSLNVPKGTQGSVILPNYPNGKHFVQLFSTPDDRGECTELGRFDIAHSDLAPLYPKPPLGNLDYAKTYAQSLTAGFDDGVPTPWPEKNLATAFLNLLEEKSKRLPESSYNIDPPGSIWPENILCQDCGGHGRKPAHSPNDAPITKEPPKDDQPSSTAPTSLPDPSKDALKATTHKSASWSSQTMAIINSLTPDVKGKPFSPDWFLLRQRLEAVDQFFANEDSSPATPPKVAESDRQIKTLQEQVNSIAKKVDELSKDAKSRLAWTVNQQDMEAWQSIDDPQSVKSILRRHGHET